MLGEVNMRKNSRTVAPKSLEQYEYTDKDRANNPIACRLEL